MNPNPDELRARMRELVAEYHDTAFAPKPFAPGMTSIPVAGRVFDAEDIRSLMGGNARFLAYGRPLCAAVRKTFCTILWSPQRHAGEFGLFSRPAGVDRTDFAEVGRAFIQHVLTDTDRVRGYRHLLSTGEALLEVWMWHGGFSRGRSAVIWILRGY